MITHNIPHSQFIRFNVPSGFFVGLATKPWEKIKLSECWYNLVHSLQYPTLSNPLLKWTTPTKGCLNKANMLVQHHQALLGASCWPCFQHYVEQCWIVLTWVYSCSKCSSSIVQHFLATSVSRCWFYLNRP